MQCIGMSEGGGFVGAGSQFLGVVVPSKPQKCVYIPPKHKVEYIF